MAFTRGSGEGQAGGRRSEREAGRPRGREGWEATNKKQKKPNSPPKAKPRLPTPGLCVRLCRHSLSAEGSLLAAGAGAQAAGSLRFSNCTAAICELRSRSGSRVQCGWNCCPQRAHTGHSGGLGCPGAGLEPDLGQPIELASNDVLPATFKQVPFPYVSRTSCGVMSGHGVLGWCQVT